MAIWYPGALTYSEWRQADSILTDVQNMFRRQTNEIKSGFERQSSIISHQTRTIIATNDQIFFAINKGLNNLAEVNERGFSQLSKVTERGFEQITGAIESLQSDLNYNFGILIQRVEYQNKVLNGIFHTIQLPFETKVQEFFNKGYILIAQGIFDKAIEYLKRSIEFDTGDIFFPSYYQLGRIYLEGKNESHNFIDPKTATYYLLSANKLGKGILRTDGSFKNVLADCKFYLSQSYYFQLSGKKCANEDEILINATKFAEEAIMLNPNLSQAYYHLAKYYSCKDDTDRLLSNLKIAVELDRNYSRAMILEDPLYDQVFEPHRNQIMNLFNQIREEKLRDIQPELNKAKNYIAQLEAKNISRSVNLFDEFKLLKNQVDLAEKDFQTGTFFGVGDCKNKLDAI